MPHDPSDPAAPGEAADPLTRALREVAGQGRRSAPGPGAAVRRRAVLRRRTRRAGLVSAGLVVAASAVLTATTLLDGTRRPAPPPAATASTTAPAPSPDDGTAVDDIRIDLSALELRAGGRTFPVSAPGMNRPFQDDAVGRVTERLRHARFSASPTGEIERHDWVMAFSGPRRHAHYLYGTDAGTDVPGRRPSTLGLIGLRPGDARWLYEHTEVGARVVITGSGT